MPTLIVVNTPKDWPLKIPDVEVVSARAYLTDPRYSQLRGAKVFNLCRSYSYQSLGYYVSLLALARGHRPLPSVETIQDMKTLAIVRLASEDLEELIQESLKPIHSSKFTLSIYFGRNVARRYDRLSLHLFKLFQAPLLRAEFVRNDIWEIQNIRPIPASEIPEEHHNFVVQVASEYFSANRPIFSRRWVPRYDLAILHNPNEVDPPSNEKALERFIRAAKKLDIRAELIERDDYNRLSEYDALFIRETTAVNHHTYRFARRAVAEGLVVIDDPDSIAKCTNKVYLAELLERYEIPQPKTLIVHRDNVELVVKEIGLPCILKQPDSWFSQGVMKIQDPESLQSTVDRLLDDSDLIIAQEFLPHAI